jgi:hypothetical protein
MERHDPLSMTASVEEQPAPSPTKKSRRLPPLLREIAKVKDETLAFLFGGPEQQPGDYQHNLQRAGKIREEFVRFCTTNIYFSNWRQAWSVFIGSQPAEPISRPPREPDCVVCVKAPALPRWKQRFHQAARAQNL